MDHPQKIPVRQQTQNVQEPVEDDRFIESEAHLGGNAALSSVLVPATTARLQDNDQVDNRTSGPLEQCDLPRSIP